MKFSRTDWKYVVDTLMFLCMVGIVAIGLLMAFIIPEGQVGPGRSKFFLGLHRHQWGDIHLNLSLAFAVLVVIHIVLAWSWVKGKAQGLFGKTWKAALGLTVVAAVLVPLIFWLAAPKNDPAYADLGTGHGRNEMGSERHGQAVPSEVPISGRMTMREVERTAGISAKDLLARLGLPDGVSLDETLGRLSRTYGFEMQALRDAVGQLRDAKRRP